MNLNQVKEIYFIGIAGIGMSAVAAMAKALGYQVSGSDQKDVYPPATTVLEENGITFYHGYRKEQIKKPDLVVLGAGETSEANPEVKEVMKRGIPVISYPELLYNFFKDKFRIVVTGTHGKTTTASLLAWALNASGHQAGFFIGGLVRDFKTNFSVSPNENLVMEGDEYYSSTFDKRPKFLHYHPSVLVITNIDLDHFDYFRNLPDLMDKFKKLIKSMPPEGVIVACHDEANIKKLLKTCELKIIWYGLKGNQVHWKGEKINYFDDYLGFTARNFSTKEKEEIKLKLFGEHNVLNCLAVVSVLDYLKIPLKSYQSILAQFQGPKRRFEIKGMVNKVIIVDDYAHHPTAVKVTLAAARARYPNHKIWAVFEPHTFSRVKATLKELAKAFNDADEVIIPDIYPAREKCQKGSITSQEVVREISQFHQNVHYLSKKEEVISYLVKNLKPNSVVIIMAVGHFNQVADLLLKKLENVHP